MTRKERLEKLEAAHVAYVAVASQVVPECGEKNAALVALDGALARLRVACHTAPLPVQAKAAKSPKSKKAVKKRKGKH